MTDALLAAILHDPSDDLARLVYADWLDEHGTEENAARAEFIRLSIRAFHDDAENGWVLQPHLHHPRKELFILNRLQHPERVIYSRGFPSKVTLPDLPSWERWGKEIAAAAPVTEMVIADREPDHIPNSTGFDAAWRGMRVWYRYHGMACPEPSMLPAPVWLRIHALEKNERLAGVASREEALSLASRAFADESRARAGLPPVWTPEKAHV